VLDEAVFDEGLDAVSDGFCGTNIVRERVTSSWDSSMKRLRLRGELLENLVDLCRGVLVFVIVSNDNNQFRVVSFSRPCRS
jgi:hypothetical protein